MCSEYNVNPNTVKIFNDYYCGPKRYEHGKKTLIAKFKKNKNSDGYNVKVYAFAIPAVFFIIKVLGSRDSFGRYRAGWEMNFASDCQEHVYNIAKLINCGKMDVSMDEFI